MYNALQCLFVQLLKNSSSLRCRIPHTYFYTALNLNGVWVGHNSFFLSFNFFLLLSATLTAVCSQRIFVY